MDLASKNLAYLALRTSILLERNFLRDSLDRCCSPKGIVMVVRYKTFERF